MKKLLLSLFAVTSLSAGAQVTIFEDSFETYDDFVIDNFGNWTTLDFDQLNTYTGGAENPEWANAGAVMAYQIFNPTTAGVTNALESEGAEENRNFDPHTGSKFAACWAGVPESNGQTATANDDWLISPVITLGASNNVVSLWVKSMSDSYGLEKYRVGIYTGTGTPTAGTDFTIISGLSAQTAPYPGWEQKTYTLAGSYANQSIRIGVRCTTADAYMFMVDDVKVTSSNMSTNDILASKFSVYPNPANNVINISSSDAIAVNQIQITDLNGRVVKQNQFDGVAQAQVNVADLASGVYMMNIASAEGIAVKKIVRN